MQPIDSLSQHIQREMARYHIPGVAVGLYHRGETWTEGFGVTNRNHPLPVMPQTLFQIGSISKTMTATLIVMLAEAGILQLDAPVQRYLPAFQVQDPEASAQVTVADLLSHVGGWEGDLFVDTGSGDDALQRYMLKMAEQPQIAPFGRYFSYNNSAFSLAGYLVELVTGQPFAQVMTERLFGPLGMDHAFYRPAEVMIHRFAVGHLPENYGEGEPGATVATPWDLARAVEPAGSVTTSVENLLTYARFHLDGGVSREGNRLLSAEKIESMQRPRIATGQEGQSIGLSWFLHKLDEGLVVSHGGATNGQMAHLLLVPDSDTALAVLTNHTLGGQLIQAVRAWLLAELLGLIVPKAEAVTPDDFDSAKWAGTYSRGMQDLILRPSDSGGSLEMKLTYKTGFPKADSPMPDLPPMTCLPTQRDTLLVQGGRYDGAELVVHTLPDGTTGWLLFGGRLHRRVDEPGHGS